MVDAAEITPPPYTELHLHTNFSLLEGASHPHELIATAKAYGYTALAITDHDNLYGAMTFATLCREAGIHPITGIELTIADSQDAPRHHVTLLAESRAGYANICRLASIAHGHALQNQKARDKRRRDPWTAPEDLQAHTEGLILLTGCRSGELARAVDARNLTQARQVLTRWIEWFGRENVYVELMDNLVEGDRIRNGHLVELAHEADIKPVATGDVHYHARSRHRLQDALVAIAHRSTLDECHEHRRPNGCFMLLTLEQQSKRFSRWPEAIASTREIASRCSFDLNEDLGYRLPTPPVPEGRTQSSQLRTICEEAITSKYTPEELPTAIERLNEELRLIAHHHLDGFFLIYHEVMRLAEEVARECRGGKPRANAVLSPGRGRGSSVSSIVCYLIGLSHIDPIRNGLFLGRFLSEEMSGFPDIDLDFPRDIRAKLFERVYEHWGRDHAAIVGLFPTYRIRSAVRDLGKALGLPAREIDRLAKLAEGYGSATKVREEMERAPQFANLIDAPGWRDLIDLAHDLAGFPRHLSQHVGGVVIASDPLIDCVPIEPAAWPGRYVCHWDKDAIDDAGMVKIDFLGLGMLSLVEECIDLVATNRGELVDLSRIDFDEKAVYDRICSGDTVGVFQIESRAQAGMLPRSQPRNLEDLACQVAIVRPGPIVGGAMRTYVDERVRLREQPGAQIAPLHPLVEPILRETLGAVLFQEQVLQIATAVGGFSIGLAAKLRKALSRRDWELHENGWKEQFMAGAEQRGVAPETAEKLFGYVSGFANFGFPKSHATAFALLAYQSAWLREHFTPEFYCALYNQWPMGFYPPHVVTNDARRHGVAVAGPDINRSDAGCTVEGEAVRIGLAYVDGVGTTTGELIAGERRANGDFRSMFDCLQRTGIAHQSVEHLIRVGAFDSFGLNRREALWQLGLLKATGSGPQRRVQLRLPLPTEQDKVALEDFDDWERMAADYTLLGLSPGSHPVALLRPDLGSRVLSAEQAVAQRDGSRIDVAGLVVCRQRPMTANGMVFLALEDETGLMNVSISSKLYEERRTVIRTSSLLQVRAKVEGRAGAVPMLWALEVAAVPARASLPVHGHNWM